MSSFRADSVDMLFSKEALTNSCIQGHTEAQASKDYRFATTECKFLSLLSICLWKRWKSFWIGKEWAWETSEIASRGCGSILQWQFLPAGRFQGHSHWHWTPEYPGQIEYCPCPAGHKAFPWPPGELCETSGKRSPSPQCRYAAFQNKSVKFLADARASPLKLPEWSCMTIRKEQDQCWECSWSEAEASDMNGIGLQMGDLHLQGSWIARQQWKGMSFYGSASQRAPFGK